MWFVWNFNRRNMKFRMQPIFLCFFRVSSICVSAFVLFRSWRFTFNSWHVNRGALDTWSLEVSISPTSWGQERCQGLSRPTTKPFRRGWFLGVSRCRGHLGMNNNTYWHLKVPCVNLVNSKTLVWYHKHRQATSRALLYQLHKSGILHGIQHEAQQSISSQQFYPKGWSMYLWHSSTRPTYGYAPKSCIHQNWIKLACS